MVARLMRTHVRPPELGFNGRQPWPPIRVARDRRQARRRRVGGNRQGSASFFA